MAKGSTILIPTDFSDAAYNAFNYAVQLFGTQDHSFVLIHAYELPQMRTGRITPNENERSKSKAEKNLSKKATYFAEKYPDIKLSILAEYGDCDAVINNQENKHDNIKAVVMGTTGMSGLQKILMGNTAQHVVRESKFPVFTIPETRKFQPLKSITFAADIESLGGDEELTFLKHFTEYTGAELNIIHIYQTDKGMPDESKVSEKLKSQAYLGKCDFNIEMIKYKNVAKGIDQYILKSKTDMLVMRPKRKGFLHDLFRQKITTEISSLARLPVLALK